MKPSRAMVLLLGATVAAHPGCIAAGLRFSAGAAVDSRGRAGVLFTTGVALGVAASWPHAVTVNGDVGTGVWAAEVNNDREALGILFGGPGVDYHLLRMGGDDQFGLRLGVRMRWFRTFDNDGWLQRDFGPGAAFAFLYNLTSADAFNKRSDDSLAMTLKSVSIGLEIQANVMIEPDDDRYGWFFIGPTVDLMVGRFPN